MYSLTETPDCRVWFTSDLHLDHKGPRGCTPLWESRGYHSPSHMSQCIIDILNDLVRENDILFNLGDLCLDCPIEQLDRYLNNIKCKNIWSLWGNHNNPHEKAFYRPNRNKLCPDHSVQWVYPVRYKNMVYLGHYHEIVVNKQLIILSHYAFQIWNESHHGSWCLCGHSHGTLPTIRPESTYGKILDMGWDLYKKPLSFDEVKTIMDKKPIQKVDHH